MRNPHQLRISLQTLARSFQKRFLRWARLYRRLHFRHQVSTFCIFVSVPALILLWYFVSTKNHRTGDSPPSKSTLQNGLFHDPEVLRNLAKIESEANLAKRYICHRESLENNLEYLGFCGKFSKPEPQKKIVALVEVRNVETTINPFLTALSNIVDSIIVLDDHSTDLTRNAAMLFNSRLVRDSAEANKPTVEALLNKTGEWLREELFDRQILLHVGRKIGGTHFVLLDYDEYFSSNCVRNGLLRRSILALNPGQSLYIPWVEVWKSPRLHAVLSTDVNMNFLRRRQVVIFADDGKAHYTEQNSVAKLLAVSPSRGGSIHVLRCPRTLCAQPPHYASLSTMKPWGNVQPLLQCKIVEMRFLNLKNMMLKSAWYEALGRITGAKDGTTSGKMVDLVLSKLNHSYNNAVIVNSNVDDTFTLAATDPEWFSGFDEHIFDAHARVELWRAQEISNWVDQRGNALFFNLKVMPMLDFSALRTAVKQAYESGDYVLRHVPRHKVGTLIIAIDAPSTPVLRDFLRQLGWPELNLQDVRRKFSHDTNEWGAELHVEQWKASVESYVLRVMQRENASRTFVSCKSSDSTIALALLEVARDEMAYLNVLVIFGDRTGLSEKSVIFKRALEYATESGSHIGMMDIPLSSFGSLLTLHWLRKRLELAYKLTNTTSSNASLLKFAESIHKRYRKGGVQFAPVAKLVFSLNVGRVGSNYLASVLGTGVGPILSMHEAACPGKECTKGGGMRMQERRLATTYSMRARVKRPMVRNSILQLVSHVDDVRGGWNRVRTCECSELMRGDGDDAGDVSTTWENREIYEANTVDGCSVHAVMDATYVETNPNFKAWFYDVIMDDFPFNGYDVIVVIIRKYVAAVLKSLFETGFFSTRDGYSWMETAAGVNRRVKIQTLENDESLDALDKLLSYVVNAEAVFRDVVSRYAGRSDKVSNRRQVRFVRVKSEGLYGVEGTEQLFTQLDVVPSDLTLAMASSVHDKYGEGGRKRVGAVSLAKCDQRVRKLIERTGGETGVVAELLKDWTRTEGFKYRER